MSFTTKSKRESQVAPPPESYEEQLTTTHNGTHIASSKSHKAELEFAAIAVVIGLVVFVVVLGLLAQKAFARRNKRRSNVEGKGPGI
ncbi:hypothetical protein GLAREA_08234 [Glarea lozoyensis ATCC 20868]|uniref:Uncharacterized protein n=1 Tax=Glarea lozoyensis (strain ATCC 20868 / MF5171) TaxID=1116229 RepID=S3CCX2_GLAL2|nr:uncharacterized protein GLAREA_08234 [Glarea lozoyensis ATCC 20868]EPE24382.1 hypothetical protein GLAREA_08234 [Glarea lozoyensis ATCC 20868]